MCWEGTARGHRVCAAAERGQGQGGLPARAAVGAPAPRRLPAGSPEQLRSSLLRSREEALPSASCPAHRAGCCRRHALPLALSPFPRAMLFVSEASSVIHVGRSTVIFTRTPKYSQPSRTGKSGLGNTGPEPPEGPGVPGAFAGCTT